MSLGKRKISTVTASSMIAVALVLDLINNIAVDFLTFGLGGFLVDAIATIIFTLWFSHLGASLWSSRNAGRTLLAMILDAIPIGDLTFPWTIQVAYTAFTERYPLEEQAKKPPSRGGWRL